MLMLKNILPMNSHLVPGDKDYFNWFECISNGENIYEQSSRLASEIRKHCPVKQLAICLTSKEKIAIIYNDFSLTHAARLSQSKLKNIYTCSSVKPYIEKDGEDAIVYQCITYNKNIIGILIYTAEKSMTTIANTWYIKNSDALLKTFYFLTIKKSLFDFQRIDTVTKCFNEEILREKLSQEIGNKDKQFAILNINNFTQINSQYGFDTGNSLLREMAILISSVLNQQDYVFRMFDDKFAIILDGDYHISFNRLLELKNYIEINEFTNIHNMNLAIKILITIGVVDLSKVDKDSSVDAIYQKALAAGKLEKNGINFSDENEASKEEQRSILCDNSVPVRKTRKRKTSKEKQEHLVEDVNLFKEASEQVDNPYFKIFNM